MIPFASQRGLGQDLATHLLNVQDNEYAEIEDLRGAIAGDLHGAFAEWEAQAHTLTKCKNYLYSLSINPDPEQGPLTRDQYRDYIARTEEKLGLENQPRAIVFHIKEGREHCHVVWSRVDADNEKAVHMAFDKDKLMMVTKDFARDHHLDLPDGYHSKGDGKTKQLSLYEMHQQRSSGLSKEDHQDMVTEAWKQSDSAKAFVQALTQRGYILATGKRPYVLVDFYGHTNSLPKLIKDKSVRTKDVRAFLKKDYAPESLPSVDEAKALVSDHRKTIEVFAKSDQKKEEIIQLKRKQEQRRQKLEAAKSTLRKSQHEERLNLAKMHKAARLKIRNAYIAKTRRIKAQRYKNRPTGLAAFLGRVSGVELLRGELHKYQDRKRMKTYVLERQSLKQVQLEQRAILQRRHDLQTLDLVRKEKALSKIEIREMNSLDKSARKEARIAARGGSEQMPALPELHSEQGTPSKFKSRHRKRRMHDEFKSRARGESEKRDINLTNDFSKAASDGKSSGDNEGASQIKPSEKPKIKRYKRTRKRDLDNDRGR